MFWHNCASCHTIGKGKLIGPDLKGVETKHPEAWLHKWIESSQALVKTGDTAAVRLFNDNAGIIMPEQDLTGEQIDSILAYITTEGSKVMAAAPAALPVASKATSGSYKLWVFTIVAVLALLTGMVPALKYHHKKKE